MTLRQEILMVQRGSNAAQNVRPAGGTSFDTACGLLGANRQWEGEMSYYRCYGDQANPNHPLHHP